VIPIPGAKTAAQARENAGALGWSLEAREVTQLEQMSRPWL
jgi:aryl-alcohol dehydrogenase-like predicted oxidoreductase